jgi:hypothetical protein
MQWIWRRAVPGLRHDTIIARAQQPIGDQRLDAVERECPQIRLAMVVRVGGDQGVRMPQRGRRGHHRQQALLFRAGAERFRRHHDLVGCVHGGDAGYSPAARRSPSPSSHSR